MNGHCKAAISESANLMRPASPPQREPGEGRGATLPLLPRLAGGRAPPSAGTELVAVRSLTLTLTLRALPDLTAMLRRQRCQAGLGFGKCYRIIPPPVWHLARIMPAKQPSMYA